MTGPRIKRAAFLLKARSFKTFDLQEKHIYYIYVSDV